MGKILSKGKKFEIEGRYVFDFGEGWSLFNVTKPYRIEQKKCFMCEGKKEILGFKCDVCDGKGILEERIYPFSNDHLADFLSSIVESGDSVKITIEVTDRKPASMWKGIIEETKDGKFLLKGDKKK